MNNRMFLFFILFLFQSLSLFGMSSLVFLGRAASSVAQSSTLGRAVASGVASSSVLERFSTPSSDSKLTEQSDLIRVDMLGRNRNTILESSEGSVSQKSFDVVQSNSSESVYSLKSNLNDLNISIGHLDLGILKNNLKISTDSLNLGLDDYSNLGLDNVVNAANNVVANGADVVISTKLAATASLFDPSGLAVAGFLYRVYRVYKKDNDNQKLLTSNTPETIYQLAALHEENKDTGKKKFFRYFKYLIIPSLLLAYKMYYQEHLEKIDFQDNKLEFINYENGKKPLGYNSGNFSDEKIEIQSNLIELNEIKSNLIELNKIKLNDFHF